MKSHRYAPLAVCLALSVAAPATPVLAQHAAHSTAPAAAKGTSSGEGEIRRIEKENKRLVIKHGPITGPLAMGAMSMMFSVKDAAMLDPLKAGDKVRFEVEQQGDLLMITKLVPLK
jgi:Cu(I)/Ag(I) efflux system periplasmic protein CusF